MSRTGPSAANASGRIAQRRPALRSRLLPWLGGVLALTVLAGCETSPADPRNVPLRQVQGDLDRLYVQCVASDPFFRTPRCRQVRLEMTAGNER